MMTKRHFQALAEVCRVHLATLREIENKTALPIGPGFTPAAAVADLIHSIANVMAEDNPRFDRARFLAACGIGMGRTLHSAAVYRDGPAPEPVPMPPTREAV